MIFAGTPAQLRLLQIFQHLERHRKTGILTVALGQQKVSMHFWQGQLMCIEPQQGYDPLERRLLRAGAISRYDLQDVEFEMSRTFLGNPGRAYRSEIQMALALTESGLVSHEQLYAWARQEATEFLRELLKWSAEEVCFSEGVQPPVDRLPLTLSITSLLPSLSDPFSSSSVSTSILRSVREEPSIPVTPHSISMIAHSFLLKKSKTEPIEEKSSTPTMPFPTIPTMFEASRPTLQERPGPITPISTITDIGTHFRRDTVLSNVTSSIHPLSNALTLKHPTPGKRFKKQLTLHATKKRYRVFNGVLLLLVFFMQGAMAWAPMERTSSAPSLIDLNVAIANAEQYINQLYKPIDGSTATVAEYYGVQKSQEYADTVARLALEVQVGDNDKLLMDNGSTFYGPAQRGAFYLSWNGSMRFAQNTPFGYQYLNDLLNMPSEYQGVLVSNMETTFNAYAFLVLYRCEKYKIGCATREPKPAPITG